MDILIPFGLAVYLLHDSRSLRIIRCSSARQNELAVHATFRKAVRFDDADGIFQVIEPGNLRHDRPRAVNAETCEDGVNGLFRQRPVLVTERVDGWRDQDLGDREGPGECRGREHSRIIAVNK